MKSLSRSILAMITIFMLAFTSAFAAPEDGADQTAEQPVATEAPAENQAADDSAASPDGQPAAEGAVEGEQTADDGAGTAPEQEAAPVVPETLKLKLNFDGTSTLDYTVALPAMWQEYYKSQFAEEDGYTFESVDLDGQEGIHVTKTFTKEEGLLVAPPGNPAEIFGMLKVEGWFFDTYIAKGYMVPSLSEQMVLSLEVPMAATFSNGERSGNTYTWNMSIDDSFTPIQLVVKLPKLIPLAILALVVLLLIVCIIIIAVSRKKKKNNPPAFTAETAEQMLLNDGDDDSFEQISMEDAPAADAQEEEAVDPAQEEEGSQDEPTQE